MRARRAARLRALAGLVALGVALAGCGIPTDEQPQALDPTPLPSSSPTVADSGREGTIYLLGDTARLVPVRREIDPDRMIASLVGELARDLTAGETDAGLSSAVPSTIATTTATLDQGTLIVDLVGMAEISGADAQRNALAQLVYTLTELSAIERVIFLFEGESTNIPIDGGEEKQQGDPVDRSDYASYQPLSTPTPTPPTD